MMEHWDGVFLLTLVHDPLSFIIETGHVFVSFRRRFRRLPLLDICWLILPLVIPNFALKSPVRIILESCLRILICVVRLLNCFSTEILLSFSCLP